MFFMGQWVLNSCLYWTLTHSVILYFRVCFPICVLLARWLLDLLDIICIGVCFCLLFKPFSCRFLLKCSLVLLHVGSLLFCTDVYKTTWPAGLKLRLCWYPLTQFLRLCLCFQIDRLECSFLLFSWLINDGLRYFPLVNIDVLVVVLLHGL